MEKGSALLKIHAGSIYRNIATSCKNCTMIPVIETLINPFFANTPFLYPLKTLRFSDVFRR